VPSTAPPGLYAVTVEFDAGPLAGPIIGRIDIPVRASTAVGR
jgi:hypothetical protein